jgi:glycosyltransferase involved in cell wall biosynthesis
MAQNKVTYSICVANLNMGNTLEAALESVLNQIDERFEVIVVDDGSTDDSLSKLENLKLRHSNLRTLYLEKDSSRTLAETRNISVREALGEYCLLHIDCDDLWEPYILDFMKVFHAIEELLQEDILLHGHQLNVGKTSFLLQHGPYRYGHMVEDRDMWFRMAQMDKYIPLEHVVFRTRMPLSRKQKAQKKFFLTGRILSDEIRTGNKFGFYFTNLWRNYMNQPFDLRAYKVAIYPLCKIRAWKLGPIIESEQLAKWNELKLRAQQLGGTVFEIFEKRGKRFDPRELSQEGQWIFSKKSIEASILEIPKFRKRI